ncbi:MULTISPECIES: heavy metal response regulator transcription factor [Acinetobacter]|uniref:heavy metal response regulator transcription factor n=1 Tax=Acinetobacter TaxID=469 RepID=UPI0020030FEC|nr:heavy metal response regulator transcription factor [Acinetobacter radioresistens]MCK4080922.1 heavy metal response regulator transcription factor [Acinetobacter radioresistens]
MNILIIEDEQKIARYLAKGLTESGYRIWLAHDGREGLMLFEQHAIDLVILDVMLPELDGWQVIQTLRQFSEVPVLFLTARDSVLDRVKGLELGADDYLVKPFSYIELLARVKTLLRRSSTKVVEQLQVENLKIDLLEHKVYRDRDLIELTNKEYALLRFLAEHQGEIMTRTQIASQVWNINFDTDTNVVDVAVRRLRAKIDDAYQPKLIHTIRGMGYKLDTNT